MLKLKTFPLPPNKILTAPFQDTFTLTVGKAQLFMKPNGEIILENSNASLMITAQGELKIKAKKITQLSQEDVRLQGKNIYLN